MVVLFILPNIAIILVVFLRTDWDIYFRFEKLKIIISDTNQRYDLKLNLSIFHYLLLIQTIINS